MNRLEQLDSIRGIAALIVFINHMFLILPIFTNEIEDSNLFVGLLKNSPLSIVWAGHVAVLIFFILSGFVLSLAFYYKPQRYKPFLIKRFCRLYIPFIIVLLLSILLNLIFYQGEIKEASNWINNQWSNISWESILSHVLFLGNYDTHVFNPPIWSLVHEMRISIVFPFIMFFIIRYKWKSIFGAFALSIIGFGLSVLTGASNIDLFITLHYASLFILGALLAMYKDTFSDWYQSLSKNTKFILVLFSLLLLTYSYWFMPNVNILHIKIINDWVSAVGALIIIGVSLSSATLIGFLKTKFVLQMGKISFSFYLTHFVVLLTFLYTLSGTLPIWMIWIVTFVTTYAISTLLYNYVEKPSIIIGRKFASPKNIESSKNGLKVS
ncbi:acyltransferase family protein [Bacillus sp. JJ1562]|uniref:acyltransferase family protein n=1 Tax=Bacillus sp. JJ1562 TaxID=3122960 RepID=UPI003002F311